MKLSKISESIWLYRLTLYISGTKVPFWHFQQNFFKIFCSADRALLLPLLMISETISQFWHLERKKLHPAYHGQVQFQIASINFNRIYLGVLQSSYRRRKP